MSEIIIAKFEVNRIANIQNRGIAIIGTVSEGIITAQNAIELTGNSTRIRFEIKSIEEVLNSTEPKNEIGLLIDSKAIEELDVLNLNFRDYEAKVYQNGVPVKLWCDFNATSDYGLRLNCIGTIRDINKKGIELQEGLKLILWDEDVNDNMERDDLIVQAVATYNKDKMIWEGQFEWNEIRNESQIKNK
jgi:hypothetical protein